ncbi:MAG: cytochrome b/b6 domain-containing protein [Natronospirillum sp.]
MKIWDLSTRLYHWTQALLFFGLVSTAYLGVAAHWHPTLGIAMAALVFWRIGWGFIGSETSRFAYFIPSPLRLWRYLKGQQPNTVGHNPLGSLMVLLLLTLLIVQSLTGLLMTDWLHSLPIPRATTRNLESLHNINSKLLMGAVLIHLSAIVWHEGKGHRLVSIMITGRSVETSPLRPFFVNSLRSISLLIVVILLFVILLSLLA